MFQTRTLAWNVVVRKLALIMAYYIFLCWYWKNVSCFVHVYFSHTYYDYYVYRKAQHCICKLLAAESFLGIVDVYLETNT